MNLQTLLTLTALPLFSTQLIAKNQATAKKTTPPEQRAQPNPEQLSLRNELKLAINRGNNYLKSIQKKEGYWHEKKLPAFTALAVYASQMDPNRKPNEKPKHIEKAYRYLESQVQKDGGIYGKGLATYNTSLCVMAFAASGDAKHAPILRNARRFLINLQTNWADNPDGTKNIMNGGVGYGGSYPHSDLSNTHFALHAIRTVEQLQRDSKEENRIDLDWGAALEFVNKCQNLQTTNPLPEAGNDGSFVYFPGNSKAGTEKDKNGKKRLKGYGSMSYAGLLSMIHANVDAEDPRIKAVMQWLQENYTLKENPGMGQQGLYYYYHTMAKALTTAGINELKLKDGTRIDWRKKLAETLLQNQREDGSWVNDNARWLESQSALVTSYAVLTLERIYYSYPEKK